MNARRNTRQEPARMPLAASEERPRLCLLPGILDANGEPVRAMATGSARRPVIRALATYASLIVAGRVLGGEA